jgi:hypothetical protein
VLRLLALLLSVVATCSPSLADELAWSGSGATSCAAYARSVQISGDYRQLFFPWAQGFMSGLNTSLLPLKLQTNLAGRSTDDQQAHIDSFCDHHPLAAYVDAVLALYDQMRHEQGLPDWRSQIGHSN